MDMGSLQDALEEEIDLTGQLTEHQVRALFDAFDEEDWAKVDLLMSEYEEYGSYDNMLSGLLVDEGMSESKAGGIDKNRGNAEKLRRYWTVGEGGAKIRWRTSGDWTRCVEHLSKYLGPRAKGYCSLRHKEMNGYWPGSKLNKSDSIEEIESNSIYHESKQDKTPDIGEPMIEHKAVGVQGMKVLSADEGIVETIISVTGMVDNVKDRIMPGAYSKTLVKRKPKGVWSHDWDTPVSKTLDVKELMPGDSELPDFMPNGDPWPREAGALKVKTQFNLETQRGREAYSDVVFFGEEQEWSIGYNVPVGGAKVDQKSGVRDITMLELYEYSPVLFGAMPLARTTSVKEAQMAMKALKGGAAAWLTDANEEENQNSIEERLPVFLEDDDYEGKEAVIDADQMILVKAAIETLTELLEVIGIEEKEMKPSMSEEPEPLDDEEYDDYESLEEAVGDMLDDGDLKDELSSAAADVDSAISGDDDEAMDSAVNAFLDVIESNMGDDDETDEVLKTIAEIVGDMIDQIGEMTEDEDREPPSEETTQKKGGMCPSCGKPEGECKCGAMDMDKKRMFSEKERAKLAESGAAMPDGSYPIENESDLKNAIQAFGRAKDKEATKKHIMRRASALGLDDMIPEEWMGEKTASITVDEIKAFLNSIKS